MSDDIAGKVIVITGASSGLGEVSALAVSTDVTNSDQVKQLVDTAVQSFGRIDAMINNATEPDVADGVQKVYKEIATPAESFARCVAFAISQPRGHGHKRDTVPTDAPGSVSAAGPLPI
jgi:NAD(P)-dependent dehydrogenase (short-subunit alcohol dehydrogenase family)